MTRILIIDDDPAIRDVVLRFLANEGYDLLAADGAEAVRLLNQQPVDLVITDVYMPDVDGFEVADWIREQAVPPKLITMSGGGIMPAGDVLGYAKLLGADRTLAKPFTREQLLQTVQEVLGERGGVEG